MTSSTAARKRPATYQDILDAPPHMVAEIIDGDLHLQPRPRLSHATAQLSIGSELRGRFGRGSNGPTGWIFMVEPELHLGRHVLVPDIAGWRRERMPSAAHEAFTTLAPDWVCEVLSPATERVDRLKKMDAYATEGVEYAWLVSPPLHMIEAYRAQERTWLRTGAAGPGDKARLQPFDAEELDISALFSDVPLVEPGP